MKTLTHNKGHIIFTLVLAVLTLGGMLVAYTANAQEFQSHVQTIEIDLEQQVATPPSQPAQTATITERDSGQFMFLVGLAALGLIGIAGVVRDVRHDRA